MFPRYRTLPPTRSAEPEEHAGRDRSPEEDARIALAVTEAERWLWESHRDFRLTLHPRTGRPRHRPLTAAERREIAGDACPHAYIRITADMVRAARAAPAGLTSKALGECLGISQQNAWRIRAGYYDHLLQEIA
ncbi:MAG: hypothetical protein IMZ66_11800 [Planctomycetes bacterium]|nr:hypothetical protein [Planctomycetota bacterium]